MTQVAKVIPLHAGSRRPAGGGTHRTVTPGPPERKESEAKQSVDTGGLLDDFRDALIAQVIGTAEFVRRRMTGDYEVDDFGFDPHFADNVVQPVLRPLFEKWFRVEVRGAENIPTDGRALVVANHAGTLPLDALMTSVAVRERAGRPLRMLAADLAFDMPLVGTVARKAGHTLACHPDAERLLREDQVVAVFPEGYKGLGKPFKERYKLQRFGRGGFVSAALKTHAPIVPCSIVGSEEIYPNLADLSSLARLLGLPYFPVTPLFPALGPLGIIPLPSKWYIEFGTPINTDVYDEVAADDPMVLFEVTDHVRETIQQTLYKLLTRRRNVFLG
ncbi:MULTISPECIES: lysophospholipid acyltransferase family protein [unclassified Rhodococcus (in: high G+C Gram-positive bacteria)]|uniref:lysophospholipid acyltransferase family protein n=1 Tax=unclassified Rhodococcus (in: high G+C Gram-positive bacteria) TaxID=192944 RepID=UPI00146B2BE6|nr:MULTISPECIES: lysophospholipid acyltransferase family protein [unclassified Rhodococcus (in: high G+C Gram-positive bacteria)]MBF0660639.1 acyltransferase family protein [Rhodococcus sp. (in: high G+C Gram-positive bacteria)]NMD94145.1 acyltransferase family protein [Rhodococcus sp. BL-253-APC-6A1W]NME77609.1 acyltransferase family protein [Rhodococcus sp. 105337]